MTEPATNNSLWRHHDVRIVVPTRAVSLLGDTMLAIVLLLYLQHAAIGVWPVAMILAVESLPPVLLTGIAGHVADTYDSKTVLVIATAAQLIACVALAFTTPLAGIFLLFLAIQVGQAFTGPTWTALVPRIVGEDGISRFVALQSGLAAVAGPVGAGLGGLLYGLAGTRTAVLIDAGTFALLLGGAAVVRTRRGSQAEAGAGPAEDVAAGADAVVAHDASSSPLSSSVKLFSGFSVIRRDAIVWPMMWALTAVIVVVGGVNVVDVFLVRQSLHTPAALYGLSEIVAAVGGVTGAVLAARFSTTARQVKAAFAGFILVGVGVVGAGRAPDFAVYLVFAAIVGLANTAVNAMFAAVLIRRTPESERGKAAASLNGLAQLGMITALVLGGAVGQAFGPRTTFVAAGAATIVVAGGCALLAARRMGDLTPEQPEQPTEAAT